VEPLLARGRSLFSACHGGEAELLPVEGVRLLPCEVLNLGGLVGQSEVVLFMLLSELALQRL